MQGIAHYPPEASVRRLKQWLNLAAKFGTFVGFDTIKRAANCDELFVIMRNMRSEFTD